MDKMASSMLKSGVAKAKKAKGHVEEGLEKVRAKPWAAPLGKALQVSSKIVGAVDGFVPGAKYISWRSSFLWGNPPSPRTDAAGTARTAQGHQIYNRRDIQ